jgi:hypothetical protein
MLGTWVRDFREWVRGTAIAMGITMLFCVACVWPLMWLEDHHHETFWVIVMIFEVLAIAFIWKWVRGPGTQTCPRCGTKFQGIDVS